MFDPDNDWAWDQDANCTHCGQPLEPLEDLQVEYDICNECWDDELRPDANPNELTLPMTEEEEATYVAELMEQSYDKACPCMVEIYQAPSYVKSFPNNLWLDKGGEG